MENLQREITPLEDGDLFIVLNHPNAKFDYSGHFHSDYEINFVVNGAGKRIIGDYITNYGTLDLLLIGPNIPHRWISNSPNAHVVTIQFRKEIIDYPIINTHVFRQIKELFSNSTYGIEFSSETKELLKETILNLPNKQGFESALEFFRLLYNLSISPNQKFLLTEDIRVNFIEKETRSRRINKVIAYIQEHFHEEIKLQYVATSIGMSESAFSHFFKLKTNRSFIDYLNDIRIAYSAKLLFETSNSISEICYASGFNNISNFNRIFKRKKMQTPSEYRQNIQKVMVKF